MSRFLNGSGVPIGRRFAAWVDYRSMSIAGTYQAEVHVVRRDGFDTRAAFRLDIGAHTAGSAAIAPVFGERFRFIRDGISGTPMKALGRTFSDDEIWRVVNYVKTLEK